MHFSHSECWSSDVLEKMLHPSHCQPEWPAAARPGALLGGGIEMPVHFSITQPDRDSEK